MICKNIALAAWLLALAMITAQPSLAQQSAAKTAVVDMQSLLRESDAGKGVLAQIRKMETDYEQTVATEQQELRQTQQKLNDERATLAPDVYQQRLQELGQKFQGYQRSIQQHQAQWDAASRSAGQKINAVVVKIVEEIEKEQKLGMVIERAAVIGTTSAPDITPEVMKRLNQQLKSVAVELPQ
jgi:Skp family chaperone for outer membrane proteins